MTPPPPETTTPNTTKTTAIKPKSPASTTTTTTPTTKSSTSSSPSTTTTTPTTTSTSSTSSSRSRTTTTPTTTPTTPTTTTPTTKSSTSSSPSTTTTTPITTPTSSSKSSSPSTTTTTTTPTTTPTSSSKSSSPSTTTTTPTTTTKLSSTTTTTPTTTSTTTTKAITNALITECLNAHNFYRQKHVDTPNLVWDKEIQQSAQNYANDLASTGKFEHSGTNQYGENLHKATNIGLDTPGQSATKAWYDEIKFYNYDKPGFSGATGHFTQVIWKTTKKIGVGIAKVDNTVIVVAQYSPPGNYRRQFDDNVLPTKATTKSSTSSSSPSTTTTPTTTPTTPTTPTPTTKSSSTTTTTPTTTSTTTTKAITNALITECLNAHNFYRQKHVDTPNLVWDKEIQQSAQNYANDLASTGKFEHSGTNQYGENLHKATNIGLDTPGQSATKAWYDEIKFYNYDKPGFSGATGHFTQVIWKTTKKIGVGIARVDNTVIVVAQYSPPGNYRRQFDDNVLPTKAL